MQTHSDLFAKVDVVGNDKIVDIYLLREEIISRIDAISFCSYFGLQGKFIREGEFRGPCPIHDGDNPNGLRIVFVNRAREKCFFWNCFTHQCEKDIGKDIFSFVSAVAKVSFKEAVELLAEMVGIGKNDIYESSADEISSRTELQRICSDIEKIRNLNIEIPSGRNPFINDDFVERSLRRRNMYFDKRGISKDVLDLFEVGHCCCPDSPWSYTTCPSRAVIPIRDDKFRLVGISGRAEKEIGEGDAKYKILSGSNRDGTLYGFYLSRQYIEQSRSIVLVEGFVDLWKCWMAGIKNVVATMGKAVTERQLEMIVGSAHKAFIVFDYDGGKNYEHVRGLRDQLAMFVSCNFDFISKEKDVDLGNSKVEDIKDFFEHHARYI